MEGKSFATDREIKNLTTDKKELVKDKATKNLYLEVENAKKGTSKTFYYRYKYDTKPYSISLGKYPSISLSVARQKASEYQTMLDTKINPKVSVKCKEKERERIVQLVA